MSLLELTATTQGALAGAILKGELSDHALSDATSTGNTVVTIYPHHKSFAGAFDEAGALEAYRALLDQVLPGGQPTASPWLVQEFVGKLALLTKRTVEAATDSNLEFATAGWVCVRPGHADNLSRWVSDVSDFLDATDVANFARIKRSGNKPVAFDVYTAPVAKNPPSVGEISDQALAEVIESVTALLHSKRLDELNNLLCRVDVPSTSTAALLAYLRVTFPVRERLQAWRRLLESVSEQLRARSVNPSEALKGLL